MLLFCLVFIAGFINAYALVSFAPIKIDLNNRTGIAGFIAIICCVLFPYVFTSHVDFFANDLHLLIGGITGCSWAALKYRKSVDFSQLIGLNQDVRFYAIPLKVFKLLGMILGYAALGIVITYSLEQIFRCLFSFILSN